MLQQTRMNRQSPKARLSRKARAPKGGRENLRQVYLRYLFQRRVPQSKKASSIQETQGRRIVSLIKQNTPTLVVAMVLIGAVMTAPTFGVAVEDLKAPIKDLKDTIFGGWMWVPKIGAAVGGCLLAVYNQSIMPLATGAGVGLGIHFYDLYIKAEGALI